MHCLEKEARLSQSLLWKLQTEAYQQLGPTAWGSAGVPFYLTSQPLAAKQFSEVIIGYIRDQIRLGQLDPAKPVYLFDLGAGSGRLGKLILKELTPSVEKLCPSLPLCYVMTDIVEKNLRFCETHPDLVPYRNSGHLDTAIFHYDQETPLFLVNSAQELSKVENPIILICTYYFDTIPQDLFRIYSGRLEEGRVTLSVPEEIEDRNMPALIAALSAEYTYHPIDHAERYFSEPIWNQLLNDYRKEFDEITFLFPTGALHSLRFFEKLSQNRMLVLSGDQGVSTKEQVTTWGNPKICLHSTFSMPVNEHLLSLYFKQKGGKGLLTRFPDPKYAVMAGILEGDGEKYWETERAFYTHIDHFEPINYWEISGLSPSAINELPLGVLLLYIKLGNWDPNNFNHFLPDIQRKLPTATPEEKQLLIRAIDQIWENFYCVDKAEGQFVMNLGVILFQLGEYQKASLFFDRAARWIPGDLILQKNRMACAKKLVALKK